MDESRDSTPGGLIGLEHEFVVRAPDGVVDFRELIRALPLGGRNLDPGDVNAQRCAWGGVVTADGAEAEIAISPLRRKPGFISRLERSAVRARGALQRALPRGLDLSGYSTHLSLSMPMAINPDACRMFLSTFAPGVMLLADRVDSPGLLVRPRPGRLELAFEYVAGPQLRGVAAYAAGAAIATAAAAAGDGRSELPPPVRAFGVTTGDRWGWGLRRDAFGDDLLRGGRATLLTRTGGGTISAQDHLERSWDIARRALAGGAAPADLTAADALVAGRAPLPLESALSVTTASAFDAVAWWPRTAHGDVLRPRRRPGFTITAEVATWDTTVFAVAGPWRRAYASVPRASLARFLRGLDAGRLDAVLTAYLDARPEGRVLGSWQDAVRPGLFDALGPARSLLAAEVPAQVVMGSGWVETGRPGKLDTPGGLTVPFWPLIGIIGLLLIGLVFALTRGGPTQAGPTPTPTVTQSAPGAQPTPAPPRVTHFVATFAGTTTTYVAEVTDPAGGGLKYTWTNTNPCGQFTFNGATAAWNHPDIPGGCPAEPVHPGAIVVTATDVLGRTATFTYTGGSAVTDIRP